MNQKEKFDARMATLPPHSLVKLWVLTNEDGNIMNWAFEDELKAEGRPKYLDVTEEQPE